MSGAPFRIFCDHFLLASERPAERSLSFQLGGGEWCDAAVSLFARATPNCPTFKVSTVGGRPRPAAP